MNWVLICPQCKSLRWHSLDSLLVYGYKCDQCDHLFGLPLRLPWPLDKSPERLAQEIKGKSRLQAEEFLRKYGASYPQAAEAVAMACNSKDKVIGTIEEIAETLYYCCKETK